MAEGKDVLTQAALDLAWSHWTGLGVRGTSRAPSTAVDPEALIYLTMALAPYDGRLRDEAADWWLRFQRHVSRPRLTQLGRSFDSQLVDELGRFEAELAEKPRTSGKSVLDRLDLPARAIIRLRCIFGANARAEILFALLTDWAQGDGVTASALSEVGYSKRNVALVLDDLRLGGLVVTSADANRTRFRLASPDALRTMLGALPATSGRWHLRLPIVAAFVVAAGRLRGKDALVQAVEARKLFTRHARSIATLGLGEPRIRSADVYWGELQGWLVENLLSSPSDASHRLPGMLEGVWIGPNQPLRKPAAFSSAVLPALSTGPGRAARMRCLDLAQVATVHPANDWAWAVLSDAATGTYEHTIGLYRGESWHFVTWEDGGARAYRAQYARPVPHGRIARGYGDLAAAHARKDRPAIQLDLTPVETDTLVTTVR